MVESGLPEKSSASYPSPVPTLVQRLDWNSADHLEDIVQTDAEEYLDDQHGSHGSKWPTSIKEKVELAGRDDTASSWSKRSIYRVPQYLKDREEKAYVPQIVSIGPYHHGAERLRPMDRHKWRILHHVLKRTKQDVKDYVDAVQEMEEKARACYEGTVDMRSDEFVEMMVLDGCFVLELFRGMVDAGYVALGYPENDPVFSTLGWMHPILTDMILLENQIPLFVLERLLGLQLGIPDERGCVAQLAIRFFEPLKLNDVLLQLQTTTGQTTPQSLHATTTTFDLLSENSGLHCLDVFRKSLLSTGPLPEQNIPKKRWSHPSQVSDIHCVSELREAGIKFKKRENARFWDIKFKDGILWIPRILIQDSTPSLFRNLIAFEQSHFDGGNDITAYTVFMDSLINSTEDVGHLHYSEILENWLGSDAKIADLFNGLCLGVTVDINDSYLSDLSAEVNRYYNNRWNKWKASLKHNYFNSPWSTISFVAAVILLLLTLAQTFYTVYGYYWPRK